MSTEIDYGPPTAPLRVVPIEVVRAQIRYQHAARLKVLEHEGLAFAEWTDVYKLPRKDNE